VTGDQTARLVAAGLMMVLVASSLFGRQLKFDETLRMVLIWVALFAVAFVLFLFREEGKGVWNRAKADVSGQQVDPGGRIVRIPMRDDGHFWVVSSVNGQRVEFMVDSGALSAANAGLASIDVSTNLQIPIDTANGTIMASPVRIDDLVIGPIRQSRARATVSAASGEMNLLGMSFLSELKSWKVEGRTLILEQ
jgi:aspartyl protease family protein